ncbi:MULTISPECIES: ATP-binding protein [Micromonospora]|uniref:ATP-binding protein n=1 Tax=Micromonospora TaxID=1873 RepID=UPI001EE91FBC|nr:MULTISPECIES: ATP-binding protein [Micromonospora]MCG5449569.1 ATP-binding protein [Micromonospora hortensis]MCX5115632.1 ATP-binding protein [Micromonospora sp. NBC_00362]WTI06041.1 ATP-binding protein [Micromonospora sp. NBC_00821]
MANPPLDHHTPTVGKPLLSTSFTLADLNRVRHEVEAVSRRCGLDHDEIENWVIAVNELMINVIRHGGGEGDLRLLLNGQLTCEVTDQGRGFRAARYVPCAERPPLSDTGGMGLWVVGNMADYLLVDSGPAGTTIRIAARTRSTLG